MCTTPPAVFAPGVISGPANDGSPTFMPDGKTLLFTRSGTGGGTILESRLLNGSWTAPRIASFSGQWNDQHPTIAPDGSYAVFVSVRSSPASAGRVAHLWRVDRTVTGWSAPKELPASVNIGPRIFAPSIAADGAIYFLSIGPHRSFQLYRSRYLNGTYSSAEPLSFSSPKTADVDPQIAPDQSFMIFASSGRSGKDDTQEHLFIAHQRNGSWTDIAPFHYAGESTNGGSNDNEPRLAPDGRTLYFSSDRTVPVSFPRTVLQARTDLDRIQAWDNGATNVWSLTLSGNCAPLWDQGA